MFVRACLIVASVGASSVCDDTSVCHSEDTSVMLQVNHVSKQNLDKVTSQMNRVANALSGASEDTATICMQVDEGEEAPAEGTFSAGGELSTVMVQQGFIAPVAGKYCITKQTLLLIQRANGFADILSFERALSGKQSPWTNENIFNGKRSPTECVKVPLMCKLSVAPVKSKICPILWSLPNSVLQMLPGCAPDNATSPGVSARQNVEGACARTLKLEWKCSLQCTDMMSLVKEMSPGLKESHMCWSPLTDSNACQTQVLSDSIGVMMKTKIDEVKANLPQAIQWAVNSEINPCSKQSFDAICGPHCPMKCQTLFDEVLVGSSRSKMEVCLGGSVSKFCNAEEVAKVLNAEMKTSSQPIRDALQMSANATGHGQVCDAAAVKQICSDVCLAGVP